MRTLSHIMSSVVIVPLNFYKQQLVEEIYFKSCRLTVMARMTYSRRIAINSDLLCNNLEYATSNHKKGTGRIQVT